MSNYCATYIRIVGLYKEMKLLYTVLDWAKEKVPNGWIGEIGNLLGVVDVIDGCAYRRGTKESVSCRSHIEQVNFDETEVGISVGDAWAPQLAVYVMLQEKFAPHCKLLYVAEEPGCDLYATNDPDYIDKLIVDVEDGESLWYVDEEEAKKYLQDLLQSKSDSMEELADLAYDDDTHYISIHKFDEVDVADFCA